MSTPIEQLAQLFAELHNNNPFVKITPGYGYLQFKYRSALTDKDEPFPEGTPVKVTYIDGAGKKTAHSKPLAIKGNQGKVAFKIELKTNLTAALDFSEKRWLNVTDKKLMSDAEVDQETAADAEYPARKALIRLPEVVGLDDCEWEINCGFFNADAARRRFEDLEHNELKGGAGHLAVVLKPEWQFVSFRYYDRHAKADKAVPQGLILDGFIEDVSKKKPVVRSTAYRDDCIIVPWIRTAWQRGKRTAGKVELRFSAKNRWVESGKGIVSENKATIKAKPFADRLKYFDLPERFDSDNWVVKLDADWKPVKDVINEATTKAKPLKFYLDAPVLCRKNLRPIGWDKDDRFTVFDPTMTVVKPDTTGAPKKPYLTTGKLDHNFFNPDKAGGTPRLIACNGVFYDVGDKRVASKGPVGARAAVKGDRDVHHYSRVKEPMVAAAGNFELHYLSECQDSGGAEAQYLMVYWSCDIDLDGATAADRNDFFEKGFTNARVRWEKKKYTFQPEKDPGGNNLTVRPVFYFEGRDEAPVKCTVDLKAAGSGRSNMSLTTAEFEAGEHSPGGAAYSENGISYKTFTMAHELGHAIGEDDEYIESLGNDKKWSPVLPRYKQYYPGMPYHFDAGSMMVSNRAPRLRHMWYFARWMSAVKPVRKLTGKTVFNVKSGVGPAYTYFLKKKSRNFYKPRYVKRNFTRGTHGRMDLFLYKLGSDETTKAIAAIPDFDSILVVRLKFQMRFSAHDAVTWAGADPEPIASRQDAAGEHLPLQWMRQFENRVGALNKRFYVSTTAAGETSFKKALVLFVPHYHFGGGTSAEHFELTVMRNNTAAPKYRSDFYDDGFKKRRFRIDQLQNEISIVRYALGLDHCEPNMVPKMKDGAPVMKDGNPVMEPEKKDGKKVKVPLTAINAADLKFLADWMRAQRGHNYTVHG